jgi:hypothetical protein
VLLLLNLLALCWLPMYQLPQLLLLLLISRLLD